MTSKAVIEGVKDALVFVRSCRWREAVTIDASEALIAALGAQNAAKSLGVGVVYRDGALSSAAATAFREYAEAWKATVEAELEELEAE